MKDANRAPFYACLYHGLCDVARKHGYALAIHGSVVTDLDLIAVPWIEDCADAITLKDALMNHISACDYAGLVGAKEPTLEKEKPHGRIAWNLYLDFGAKVDLSVMPKQSGNLEWKDSN